MEFLIWDMLAFVVGCALGCVPALYDRASHHHRRRKGKMLKENEQTAYSDKNEML
jgi:hypothetical protein